MSAITENEFLGLIEQYKDEFYRFVYRSVWNPSDADDVFSEAVMVAWEKRASFQVGTNFRAWFYRILLNKSFVANRHTKRSSVDFDSVSEVNLDEAQEDPQAFTEPDFFLDQIGDDLLQALNGLRQPERTCLLLRAADSCSYKEIAEIMEIPVGTVMTHLARGRSKIRRLLRETARKQEVPTSAATRMSLSPAASM